jgi:hypothetical protein
MLLLLHGYLLHEMLKQKSLVSNWTGEQSLRKVRTRHGIDYLHVAAVGLVVAQGSAAPAAELAEDAEVN